MSVDMNVSRARVEEVVRAVVHEVRAEKLTFMAGSIAYHAFVSILPLLLLLVTVTSRLQNVELQDNITDILEAVLTQNASQIINQGLGDASTGVSVLGGIFLVWGTLRIFRGLDTAFSDIYETESENTFADQLGDGLLLLVTVGLAILIASLISNVFAVTGDGLVAGLLRFAVTTVGLGVVFYPMYYVFPDTDVTFHEILPGVLLAAGGITTAQTLFQVYSSLRTADDGNLVASVLVLLTWLYIVGFVILLGAAVNAVLSNRSRDVDIDPVVGGVSRRKGSGRAPIQRDALLEHVERIRDLLADGESVTVTVDGETVDLEPPQSTSLERQPAVFGLDTSVALELRWWPDDGDGTGGGDSVGSGERGADGP